MKLNSTTIITVVGALILAALAYWYFFTGTGNAAPITTGAAESPAQMQFQTLVGELQPITFNTAVFTDPRFTALVDISTPVTPQPPGRLDPFAPVAAVASAPAAGQSAGK